MARVRKRDKWKLMLDEVEEKHRQLEATVAALEEERVQLIDRADMLSVVAEGLGTVKQHLQQQQHQLQAHHHHHHPRHAHHQQQEQQVHNLRSRAQLLEQHIQMALQHLNEPSFWPAELLQVGSSSGCLQDSGCGGEPRHCSTVLLQSMFEPAWVEKVMSMSVEETIARLKHLVGQCAIMSVKAAAADSCAAAASVGSAAASAGSSTAAHGLSNTAGSGSMCGPGGWAEGQVWNIAQQPAAAVGSAATGGVAAGSAGGFVGTGVGSTVPYEYDNTATAAAAAAAVARDGSHAALPVQKGPLPPPLEFSALMLTLLFFDEKRFMTIQYMDLETRQNIAPPIEFWASVGVHMQMTPKQITTLTAMNDRMESGLRPLFGSINNSAKQALVVAAQQEQQPQLRLLHEQTQLLEQQGSALAKIKWLVLQMGIVAVNTLTMRQLALQQSLCYPFSPRMDLILEGMLQSSSSSK